MPSPSSIPTSMAPSKRRTGASFRKDAPVRHGERWLRGASGPGQTTWVLGGMTFLETLATTSW